MLAAITNSLITAGRNHIHDRMASDPRDVIFHFSALKDELAKCSFDANRYVRIGEFAKAFTQTEVMSVSTFLWARFNKGNLDKYLNAILVKQIAQSGEQLKARKLLKQQEQDKLLQKKISRHRPGSPLPMTTGIDPKLITAAMVSATEVRQQSKKPLQPLPVPIIIAEAAAKEAIKRQTLKKPLKPQNLVVPTEGNLRSPKASPKNEEEPKGLPNVSSSSPRMSPKKGEAPPILELSTPNGAVTPVGAPPLVTQHQPVIVTQVNVNIRTTALQPATAPAVVQTSCPRRCWNKIGHFFARIGNGVRSFFSKMWQKCCCR